MDDEEALASVGKKMLERLGYVVTTKTSALEAMAAVRDQPEPFDLVITDLTMPVMDGANSAANCCKSSRNCRFSSRPVTAVMTEDKARELGFRGLLIKPSTARAMGEAVHRALHET